MALVKIRALQRIEASYQLSKEERLLIGVPAVIYRLAAGEEAMVPESVAQRLYGLKSADGTPFAEPWTPPPADSE